MISAFKKLHIGDTENQLLKYLHAVKVASYEQIHRDIYPSYHLRSICNRLLRLEEAGLVTGQRNHLSANGKKVISISKRAFETFVANGQRKKM